MGLFCGLLIALHPVHVEAVASVENRKELLAMLFVMLGLLVWLSRIALWLRAPLLIVLFGSLCSRRKSRRSAQS